MTAQWEASLNAISQKQANYAAFMEPLEKSLRELINQSQNVLPTALKGIKANVSAKRFKKKKNSKPTKRSSKKSSAMG